MTTNNSFPRTQDLIQSVQRQVQTLIERTDAYNMQVSQDWETFRWSRVRLLSDPASKLIRMKVHVFSDSALCVGASRHKKRTMRSKRVCGNSEQMKQSKKNRKPYEDSLKRNFIWGYFLKSKGIRYFQKRNLR